MKFNATLLVLTLKTLSEPIVPIGRFLTIGVASKAMFHFRLNAASTVL